MAYLGFFLSPLFRLPGKELWEGVGMPRWLRGDSGGHARGITTVPLLPKHPRLRISALGQLEFKTAGRGRHSACGRQSGYQCCWTSAGEMLLMLMLLSPGMHDVV